LRDSCNPASAVFVERGEVLMQTRLLGLALAALVGTAASLDAQGRPTTPPAPAASPAAKDVSVTVNYTGKGTVDAGHTILVFLFADPNIGPESRPLGPPQVVQKNGSTVKFTNVTAAPVYICAIYDDKGGYDGRNGPPPAGTPIGMYTKDAKSPPAAVTPGPKTAIKLTFSDAKRWGR
jgi:hypothetical protein